MRQLYPPTHFSLANTICGQLSHVLSEIDEAAEAAGCADFDMDFAADPRAVLAALAFFRELADVQASIETLWRVLDRVIGAGFSEAMILAWTEEKNRGRGYYVENGEVIALSLRGQEWEAFAAKVGRHIETYTVPQYGDKGEDQASGYTTEDHVKQAMKYLNRFGRNARPGQQGLDFLKAAHYIQLAATTFEEAAGT